MDDWEDITAKDALVEPLARWQFDFLDSIYDRKFETFQTLRQRTARRDSYPDDG